MSDRKIAVITGASAGVGRATARLRRARLRRGPDGQGQAGLEAAARRRGRPAAGHWSRPTWPASTRSTPRPAGGRGARADRRLGERRHDDRLRPLLGREAGRLPAGRGGHLPRPGLGHQGRARPDAAPGPGQHRERRLGPRLRRDPAAVRLLLVQVRLPGSSSPPGPNCSTRKATCDCQHGAPPRGEHAAVRLVRDHADRTPSRSRPSTSPRSPPGHHGGRPGRRRAKVVGSWNKLLVAAGSIFPGLGNQYAALGAWEPN